MEPFFCLKMQVLANILGKLTIMLQQTRQSVIVLMRSLELYKSGTLIPVL
jgi:hypothetical protein